jgi:hypothetical protein
MNPPTDIMGTLLLTLLLIGGVCCFFALACVVGEVVLRWWLRHSRPRR